MILNFEEIKRLNIIDSPIEKEFGNASYDLTIDKIIDMNNKVEESFTLRPQGMAYVLFKEKLKVPNNLIGFAHVKTSLTKLGIMATNIGIIDPTYSGYMSTLLINFGKTDHRLNKGDTALRITFSEISNPENCKLVTNTNITKEEYINDLQKKITHLDEKFLNLNMLEERVIGNVKKVLYANIRNYVGLFTVTSFIVVSLFQVKGCYDRKHDKLLNGYEKVMTRYGNENQELRCKLNEYEEKFITINDSIDAHAKRISEYGKGKKF